MTNEEWFNLTIAIRVLGNQNEKMEIFKKLGFKEEVILGNIKSYKYIANDIFRKYSPIHLVPFRELEDEE